MTNGKYIFTAMLGVASLNTMAQCPIKDEIMGNHPVKELNARVPDGVLTSGTSSQKPVKKGVGAPMNDDVNKEHCHHNQDVHCEMHCDGNHPHNALKLRESDEDYDSFNRFRLGGYGEMISAFKGYGLNRLATPFGNTLENRATISIPRFVLALDYKINPKWIVGAEIEFESGGTGIAYELEFGRTERSLSKGGEVNVEQFYITRLLHPAFNLRFGQMVVPMGLSNAHNEPMNFFGTARPEGEASILPYIWHESGLAAYGTFGKDLGQFNYQAMVVSGLNAKGFSGNHWVHDGQQGLFEQDDFTNPAWLAHLDWVGVHGLRIGASLYHCSNTALNSFTPKEELQHTAKHPVTLWSIDAQWLGKYVEARADIVSGKVGNADKFVVANEHGEATSHEHGEAAEHAFPLAKRALSYGAEVGLNLKSFFGNENAPDVIPFVRYEYYNPMEELAVRGEKSPLNDAFKTSMWVAGVNYRLGKDIVLKADYTHRTIAGGAYRSENEFAIGAAFNAWFLSR